MADVATLDFHIPAVSTNQVEILVKNSGEELSKPLMIEFRFPLSLVSKNVADAVEKARQQNLKDRTTASKVSLGDVVTGPAGWSFWATTERTESLAVIRLLNDQDQTGKKLTTTTKLDKGVQFNVRVPLTPQDKPAHVEVPYSHRYPNEGRSGKQVDGKLELTTAGAGATPKVFLKVDHTSPTTIAPGSKVNISWEIENGVSATLYGPLPGGNSQMSLSSVETATYKIKGGTLEIIAVGAATYILHAEVRCGDGKPNEMVIRTVHIDLASVSQYSFLDVRPSKVLPHGMIEINWAVWDSKQTWLTVEPDYEIELKLTEQGHSQQYQGSGVWRVKAPEKTGEVSCWLEILQNNRKRRAQSDFFTISRWLSKPASPFTGNPIGLAVAAPKLALLTTDGLWIAEVGEVDPSTDPIFKPVSVSTRPKAWRAIAAFETGYVVLQQTNDDELQLARYSTEGKPEGLPVDLPGDVQPLVRGAEIVCDLAVLGERVYIVVEAALPGEPLRFAFSVTFQPRAHLREEPLLEPLPRYRLIAFDGALYAISRSTGRMFRFRHTDKGELDYPAKAATAAKNGQSMIRQGLMIPVGRVLVVLGPSSIPAVDELECSGPMSYSVTKEPEATNEPITQDLVYNPQQDHWIPCGHGLDVEHGAVVAFRPGASKRLWVIHPNKSVHTLTGTVEHLFAPEFEEDFSPKTLVPYIDGKNKRKITIKNDALIDLVGMSDQYRVAGLNDFSASGPASVRRIDRGTRLGMMSSADYEFTFNEADPVPMKLRFLADRKEGWAHDYMLEVTLSGQGLSSITSVFKRLSVDAKGKVSVAEVNGTRVQHGAATSISVPQPRQLLDGLSLQIHNSTGHYLMLRRPRYDRERFMYEERITSPIIVAYNSPAFFFYITGLGEFPVDIDLALPLGIEVSERSSPQTVQVRIDPAKAGPISFDSVSMTKPGTYECRISYLIKKQLEAVYMGDGESTENGSAVYLPLALPTDASKIKVWKINSNDLSTTSTPQFIGKGLFSVPNSVAVMRDKVILLPGDNILRTMDHNLQVQTQHPYPTADYTAVTNFCGNITDNEMCFLGMKEERANQGVKYAYRFEKGYFGHRGLASTRELSLDTLKGYNERNRVAGAPAWVSSLTISPMTTYRGIHTAICIEGGLILADHLLEYKITEVRLEGTGRQEAVTYEPHYEVFFCAHSQPDNQGLIITRVDRKNPQDRKTLTLPGPVVNMATDTRPFNTPALAYKAHRAVSLAIGAHDGLFVTHGKNIYYMDSQKMTIRRTITVDLPCRILQVWYGPSGTQDATWSVIVLGATYTGDGTKVDQYKTELYKFLVPRF